MENRIVKSRPAKYPRLYNKKWELYEEFSGWLAPVDNNQSKAYCTVCCVLLSPKIWNLRIHNKSSKHLEKMKTGIGNNSNLKCYLERYDFPIADLSRSDVYHMMIDNFKTKININDLKKQMLLVERRNIALQIDMLKEKRTHLIEDISRLKREYYSLPDNEEIFEIDEIDNLTENPRKDDAIRTYRKTDVLGSDQIEKIQCSPYVVLVSKKRLEDGTKKKFFIGELFGDPINQHFELESEDPFQIFPTKSDVILKSEYIDMIKNVVLESFSRIGSENIIPCVSFTTKNSNLELESKIL